MILCHSLEDTTVNYLVLVCIHASCIVPISTLRVQVITLDAMIKVFSQSFKSACTFVNGGEYYQ